MNWYLVTGVIGVVSGILCAQADVPLAWSGRKGEPLGDSRSVGKIAPWWSEVPERHFDLAFWLSCIGQPGTYLTMWLLAVLIARNNPGLGLALKINTFIGAYTGLLFHATACTKPLVYRRIHGKLPEEAAEAAVEAVGKYPRIPSWISAVSLFLVTTGIVVAAILSGALPVSKIFVLFNPVGALPILLLARKLNVKIGGAMGIGFSLFAVVLIAAGLAV